MLHNSSTHYGTIARLLHWGMAALIILSLVVVELHEFFPKGSGPRAAMMTVHFQIGVTVLLLIWVRLAVIFTGKVPPIVPAPPLWQHIVAKLAHLALYLAMIALPILGIVMQQADDKAVALLGMQLPGFVGVDKDFSKVLKEVHETLGNIMIVLIVAHVAAAIWHHRVQKDNTLLRMLPPRANS
ncbi:MAG: cytochrome b [Nitrosomonadales bacterium]|nr:cytochrome b [candidate division KSB1 bacterium]MBI5660095.1 cytochrome b [Nitrosomonadales bacterium]